MNLKNEKKMKPQLQTLLSIILQPKIIQDYKSIVLCVLPGGNNHPLRLFSGVYNEELNSPTLFFGQSHDSKIYETFSYQQIA